MVLQRVVLVQDKGFAIIQDIMELRLTRVNTSLVLYIIPYNIFHFVS